MPTSEYKVITFIGGETRKHDKINAISHAQAMKMADTGLSKSHMMVVGKTIKRYISPKKQVTGAYNVCKVLWKGVKPSIILMIGNVPEVYKFSDKYARDKVFEEMNKCITSMSAGSAKAEAELTDIIVSLDEIKGIRSTSTSKKTSSGSAISATWKAEQTQESIAKSSGEVSAGDMATNTWSNGSSLSHSKRRRTFLATVKIDIKHFSFAGSYVYPGVNNAMKRMIGKTYEFYFSYTHDDKRVYKSKQNAWFWLEDWLDKDNLYAKVKQIPEGTKDSVSLETYSSKYAGKIIPLELCDCGCGLYKHDGHYYMKEWLEYGYGEEDYVNQNMEKRGTRNS